MTPTHLSEINCNSYYKPFKITQKKSGLRDLSSLLRRLTHTVGNNKSGYGDVEEFVSAEGFLTECIYH